MKKFILFNLFLAGFILIFLGGCAKKEEEKNMLKIMSEKQVLLIIAFDGYQDKEYEDTRVELESSGVKIMLASNSKGMAHGSLGGSINVNLLISEVKADQYDAIIFIGGPGAAVAFQKNSEAHRLAKEAISQNKILAAICIGPTILAKAGVLKNKKATVWSSLMDKSPIEILKQNGAEYVDQNVVVDGKIITANGPSAAKDFGKTIVKKL
ncbi:DJ-1/PfpI family protein [Candidatus Kuenenbacteria bacterium]|nr:DJ-1/PfpI family protein [Candidatus Kuenenbacteria bacterium]